MMRTKKTKRTRTGTKSQQNRTLAERRPRGVPVVKQANEAIEHHEVEIGALLTDPNLDTLAWYTGRLVVGVFNDDVAGGPVSLLEVRGEAVETRKKARARA